MWSGLAMQQFRGGPLKIVVMEGLTPSSPLLGYFDYEFVFRPKKGRKERK
jgi:hypothetical protein